MSQLDFLREDEADELMKALDDLPWQASQSGRRKQVCLRRILKNIHFSIFIFFN